MKISQRYARRLESYLEWAKCTTPFSGGPSENAVGLRGTIPFSSDGPSAAEWILSFESLTKTFATCSEPDLALTYRRGKANRDWWNKDIGWWNREAAAYFQEEFLSHLNPECFAELFGRWPRTHMARKLHDNDYSQQDFESDAERFFTLGLEREQCGWRYLGGA